MSYTSPFFYHKPHITPQPWLCPWRLSSAVSVYVILWISQIDYMGLLIMLLCSQFEVGFLQMWQEPREFRVSCKAVIFSGGLNWIEYTIWGKLVYVVVSEQVVGIRLLMNFGCWVFDWWVGWVGVEFDTFCCCVIKLGNLCFGFWVAMAYSHMGNLSFARVKFHC